MRRTKTRIVICEAFKYGNTPTTICEHVMTEHAYDGANLGVGKVVNEDAFDSIVVD